MEKQDSFKARINELEWVLTLTERVKTRRLIKERIEELKQLEK